jgi:hypothetical protein
VNYWQIAAGSGDREYSDLFIKHGLAFVGGIPQREAMKNVKAGDCIVLKRGKSQIVAVGIVVVRDGKHGDDGDKDWLLDFDGWRLPAYCHVDWHKPPEPVKVTGLAMSAIQALQSNELRQIANDILNDFPCCQLTYSDPPRTRIIEDREILEFLVGHGLRPSAADELTVTLRRVRLLANYYYEKNQWRDVREHETRTFLVVPFLLALGWAEQQIKIELGTEKQMRIDIACFKRPYHRDKNGAPNNDECALLIETKGFNSGLNYASDQAMVYADYFPSANVVVVTNGYCYKAYGRVGGTFSATPSAYLNLIRPRDRYPLDPNVKGALDVLQLLLPNGHDTYAIP